MGWKKVTLNQEDVAKAGPEMLQEAFSDIFVKAGAPEGVAMFAERAGPAYYFSPAAVERFGYFMVPYEPEDCAAPSRKSVSLLVGNQRELSLLA